MTAYGRPPTSIAAVASGLVHRHGRVAEAADPGPVAERRGERGSQDERDVLDGVVVVDLEVAGRPDLEVQERVVGERGQEVIVEADAGRDRRLAACRRAPPGR